jgi:GR25 family glycosyltransferase involved in LPS biosynthesis
MDKLQNYKIYVINLDERLDKLTFVARQINKLGLSFERISACKFNDSKIINSDFVAPARVQANWISHLDAYQKLIDSRDSYCLILEDDCEISEKGISFLKLLNEMKSLDFDILQIGFLENKFKVYSILSSRIKLKFLNMLNTKIMCIDKFHFQSRINNYVKRKLFELEFTIEQSKKLNLDNLIVPEVLSGTHAYLINKEIAKKILQYNRPIVMGADLAIQMLGISGNWKIYRTPVSFASQYNFTVDIGQHETIPRDLGSHIQESQKT